MRKKIHRCINQKDTTTFMILRIAVVCIRICTGGCVRLKVSIIYVQRLLFAVGTREERKRATAVPTQTRTFEPYFGNRRFRTLTKAGDCGEMLWVSGEFARVALTSRLGMCDTGRCLNGDSGTDVSGISRGSHYHNLLDTGKNKDNEID